MTNIADFRTVTAVRGPVGPVLLLPVLTVVVTNGVPGAVMSVPPLERLRTAVRIGACADCGAKWQSVDTTKPMPVFLLSHLAGCAAVAAFEGWLARAGIPGGFPGAVRWEVEPAEMTMDNSPPRREE